MMITLEILLVFLVFFVIKFYLNVLTLKFLIFFLLFLNFITPKVNKLFTQNLPLILQCFYQYNRDG